MVPNDKVTQFNYKYMFFYLASNAQVRVLSFEYRLLHGL